MSAFSVESWTTTRRTVARIVFGHGRPECRALQVEATPKGRNVRIFMERNEDTGGVWQGLTLQLPDGATVEVRGSDFYVVDVRRPDGSMAGWVMTDHPTPTEDMS